MKSARSGEHQRLPRQGGNTDIASYDTTGNTHECKFADADEAGWEAYFEDLFERLDRKILDEDKARYQGR